MTLAMDLSKPKMLPSLMHCAVVQIPTGTNNMLLQPTVSQSLLRLHHDVSLSSTPYNSLPFPIGSSCTSTGTVKIKRLPLISCSSSRISQVHSYGTVDYERRPMEKWNAIYNRVSNMKDPAVDAATVLNECEKRGNKLNKWSLSRIVKELRKFRRFRRALEVYQWMNNRPERFRVSTSDAAIQLDLVSKVRGVSDAEEYFLKLPDESKDKRTYGSLLNIYVQAKMRDKAESSFEKMRDMGYATHPLPFNVMMTLYMNFKEYNKVDSVVLEMREKNIPLDMYSYNIWLSCCGAQESAEKMEQVFEQMKLEKTINPNWTTFSTMATVYAKLGLNEKAEECLKNVESRITGRDRIPYHYLVSLYGSIGKKEQVYRVWNIYKSNFPTITNLGYHTMISSLARMNDIGGAEELYQEWLSVKSTYDCRIANLLMAWYTRNGLPEKARSLFDQMVAGGGKPNSSTWEILVEVNIREKKIPEALSCLKKAVSVEGSENWKPKPVNVSSIFNLCQEEEDLTSKDVLLGLLSRIGCLEDEAYTSCISSTNEIPTYDQEKVTQTGTKNNEDENVDGFEMHLNQLEGSL